MDIFGTYTFNAQIDRVWDLLMDPNAISSCIPGCYRFEPDGEDRYKVTLSVAMAAITGIVGGSFATAGIGRLRGPDTAAATSAAQTLQEHVAKLETEIAALKGETERANRQSASARAKER